MADSHSHEANAWRVTAHGTAFAQYVHTFGTRAAYQLGSVNRLMLETGGPLGGGRLRVRVMGSAEPLTLTGRGAPQLLQTAFSNDGATVTDHAHPNRWLMELAVQYDRGAVSVYAAPIGEPALGPPTYLHRASAAANPVTPLGHHAQDDRHASFGVVTLGLVRGPIRIEGSLFNAREPDDFGTVFGFRGARLNAYGTRVTAQASPSWRLSASYGYLPATGGTHAHATEHRYGAAALFSRREWSLSVVYGAPRHSLLVEGQRESARGVFFGRVEFVRRTAAELSLVGAISPEQSIGAVQLGYARRVLTARVGAYGTMSLVPGELVPFYGSRVPLTIAAFCQVL